MTFNQQLRETMHGISKVVIFTPSTLLFFPKQRSKYFCVHQIEYYRMVLVLIKHEQASISLIYSRGFTLFWYVASWLWMEVAQQSCLISLSTSLALSSCLLICLPSLAANSRLHLSSSPLQNLAKSIMFY